MATVRRKIAVKDDFVRFGGRRKIPLRDFPSRFCQAVMEFNEGATDAKVRTFALEKEGARLARKGFADKKAASDFIHRVLTWGGAPGDFIRGRIEHFGTMPKIVASVAEALTLIKDDNFSGAMKVVVFPKPRGLDISFASKILRMLKPEIVGAFDGALLRHLPYTYSTAGWAQFCFDCKATADELEYRGIINPERKSGRWFAADVEAVLSQFMREEMLRKRKKGRE